GAGQTDAALAALHRPGDGGAGRNRVDAELVAAGGRAQNDVRVGDAAERPEREERLVLEAGLDGRARVARAVVVLAADRAGRAGQADRVGHAGRAIAAHRDRLEVLGAHDRAGAGAAGQPSVVDDRGVADTMLASSSDRGDPVAGAEAAADGPGGRGRIEAEQV